MTEAFLSNSCVNVVVPKRHSTVYHGTTMALVPFSPCDAEAGFAFGVGVLSEEEEEREPSIKFPKEPRVPYIPVYTPHGTSWRQKEAVGGSRPAPRCFFAN